MNQKIKHIFLEISESIQLIFVYLYAFFSLNTTISGYFGESPDFLVDYFPYFEILTGFQIKNFQNSERSIFMYLIIINLLSKSTIPLPKIVKFNIILVLIFEMLMTLIIYLWDLMTNRDINILNFEYDFESLTPFFYYDNIFYSCLWVFYFFLYLYIFIYAIKKDYPKFPGYAQKITDSILFLFKKQERLERILQMEKENKI
jgi:hypothetical protein